MADFLSEVCAIVGRRGIVDNADADGYLIDRRGYYRGRARAVVRPRSTAEVAGVVSLCGHYGVPIVPQGGNTGLCGGATPDESADQIVLCLSRMDDILDIDPVNYTVTVESGVVLQRLHEAADEHGLLFPLDLGAKGTCQVGGNLSTNAGGNSVLRYGNARDLVLGLEVVLADGSIWNGLSKLRKDNTGYDLKQLFIGAEGTLGIITAAVLKLYPSPLARHTAFIAVASPAAACELLSAVRRRSLDAVVSFEYVSRPGLDLVGSDPLAGGYEHYVLFELAAGEGGGAGRHHLEDLLAFGMEREWIVDGTIAHSEHQRDALWGIREAIPTAQKESVKNDVSVPVSRIPELLERADSVVQDIAPGARPCPFGHIGDGNIHYNILAPEGEDPAEFRQRFGALLIEGVNELVVSLGGSFSAEHGIGMLRRGELHRYKEPIEIELMRRVKTALDPDNLFNPGKIL